MTVQDDLFSLPEGREQRDRGITQVSDNEELFIEIMREKARELSDLMGQVTSDDLRRYALSEGLKPHHPNVWGAIFKGKDWTRIGIKQSLKKSNHARWIHIWKWQPT